MNALISSMDSDKWKWIQKDLWNFAWISTKEDFDKAQTRLWLETALFVKDISWAAVTDAEFQRLSWFLFWEWDTPEAAKQKIQWFRKALLEEATTVNASYLWINWEELLKAIYPEFTTKELPIKEEVVAYDTYIKEVTTEDNEYQKYINTLD